MSCPGRPPAHDEEHRTTRGGHRGGAAAEEQTVAAGLRGGRRVTGVRRPAGHDADAAGVLGRGPPVPGSAGTGLGAVSAAWSRGCSVDTAVSGTGRGRRRRPARQSPARRCRQGPPRSTRFGACNALFLVRPHGRPAGWVMDRAERRGSGGPRCKEKVKTSAAVPPGQSRTAVASTSTRTSGSKRWSTPMREEGGSGTLSPISSATSSTPAMNGPIFSGAQSVT